MNQMSAFPPQHQNVQPGRETMMHLKPVYDDLSYKGSGKLTNRVAIVTGGDSGICRAVCTAFAKEGADISVVFLSNKTDAEETKTSVENYGRKCLLIESDLREEGASRKAVQDTLQAFSHIDILVNNIAVQYPQNSITDISKEQLEDTFKTNIFSYFYMTKAVVPYLKQGAAIINTASVTAYKGSEDLIDYSTTKGAIVSFTRSLSLSLIKNGIRVNAVAPGPVWTPLIPSSFSPQKVQSFGTDVPEKHAAQPYEIAPAYVYLASDAAGYVSGQVLHVNGGVIVAS